MDTMKKVKIMDCSSTAPSSKTFRDELSINGLKSVRIMLRIAVSESDSVKILC
jgi:hypothetical protein